MKIYVVAVLALVLCEAYLTSAQRLHLGEVASGVATGALNNDGKPYGVGAGGYNREKGNWNAGGFVGVGKKVWESQNGRHSVGVGGAYSQAAGRQNGYNWKTKPGYGVGVGYQYRWGK